MGNAQEIERMRAQATLLHRAGKLGDAERFYAGILNLYGTDIEALHMLGVLRLQQGRAQEAFAILDGLAARAPVHAEIRTHRGLVLQELGRAQEAMDDFDAALALKPDNAMTLLYRANLLMDAGLLPQAVENYDRLLAYAPQNAEAWFRRGSALWQLDRARDAVDSYDQALAADPGHFRASFNKGTALLHLNRHAEAFAAFEHARALAPNHRYMLGGLAGALLGQAELARWPAYQAQLTDAVGEHSTVIPPLTFLPFCDDGLLRRACSDMFVADRVPAGLAPLWTGERYDHKRIRIAYLSADFQQHATASLMAGLIAAHDRARFEITAISFGPDDGSEMRARLVAAFDHFEDVQGRSDADVARFLRDGAFDIAVDLKGHTEGARPGILAYRPCPVQVNFLGYPGTVASWLDYVLGDAVALPFAHQPFYHEKIVHLPHCYQPNDPARAIARATPTRAQAGLPQQGFVFCCFNAPWKINPTQFDLWMRLLAEIPGSVLWLLEANADMPRSLRSAAKAKGIDPARLIFAPPLAPDAHLARHRLADLFLDTLPYNAHTTASDALWAGLPVLTQAGNQFDGRVAASLLCAAGIAELVTHSSADHEALALALARDPQRLAAIRGRLAANRDRSPLFDAAQYCRHIEAAYVRMVEMCRAGAMPENFAVAE
ncbi:MAG: repeat-containing protein [Alphaproteobacteria bacterium]|nr:repeat-containing protein [Alphaproteobacteria bacterium]MDB5739661.1 repeat-containing protein [Alphaproteobacteria bacterium]